MSAIGAVLARKQSASPPEWIERMASALAVHGPLRQSAARLSRAALCWAQGTPVTYDDEHDRQPISAGGVAFVFAGRLHFRGDLARALGISAASAATMADSALACAAWQRWGKTALSRMEGRFALIAAQEHAGTLVAARSALTAPPLLYWHSADLFAIATAPRGLFAVPGVTREIDDQRLAEELVQYREDRTRTWYRGVMNLPVGEWIEVSADTVRTGRIDPLADLHPVRFSSDGEYVEAANALLRDAVSDAMQGTAVPACTLSAGLDSTALAVTALAALERGEHGFAPPLTCFTSVPADDWDGRVIGRGRLGDESAPVLALGRMYPDLRLELVDSAGLGASYASERLMHLAEVPILPGNSHWGLDIYERAAAAGHQVLLVGTAGNRTLSFSLAGSLAGQFRTGHFREVHANLRGMQDARGLPGAYMRHVVRPLVRSALPAWMVAALSPNSMLAYDRYSAVNEGYARDMQVKAFAKANARFTYPATARAIMERMFAGGTPETNALPRLAMESATGIEQRDPLGYARITRFCAAIPDNQFMRNGQDRLLIRRMMNGRLPPEIANAPRGRQAADLHQRMTRERDRYVAEVETIATDPFLAARLDVPRLRKVLESWPHETPLSERDHPEHLLITAGLGRTLAVARFVRWVRGGQA